MMSDTFLFDKKFRYLPKLIDEIQDYAIILLDNDGTILNWNRGAERIKGYTPSEIQGKSFKSFYLPEDLENKKPDRLLELARVNGRAEDEGWRVKKDGSLFWGSITITAIHDDDDIVRGFVKLTRDLSERKRAEEALIRHTREIESKNKELEQYTYIASHDLQEPLRTVMNFVDLLEIEYSDKLDENGKLYLDFINQATGRMSNLIKGLLDYSRIGKKKELAVVDCNELVADITKDLEVAIKNSKAKIIIGDLPEIRAYRTELASLFQNLISNAIKFRKKDSVPEILISAEFKKEGWEFMVKDNGIGIEERHLQKIFIIFQRIHSRAEFEGTGIGLAHCKKIVELHRGKLWVNSTYGEGSTFYFTINTNR